MKKDDENFGLLGDEEQEEESGELQRRKDKLKFFRVIKTINCIFSSLLFCLGIILLIDYVFYSEEFTKIPVKCFSNGECDFPALAPSKKPPHLIYLGFKGFSQNYREYVDSIAIEQFYEENLYVKKVKEKCWPMIKNSDFGARKSFTGEDISENSTALPCGLIAYSYPDSKIFLQKKIFKKFFKRFFPVKLDVSIPGNITKKLPLYTFKTSPRFYQEIYKIKNDSKSWLNFKDESKFFFIHLHKYISKIGSTRASPQTSENFMVLLERN